MASTSEPLDPLGPLELSKVRLYNLTDLIRRIKLEVVIGQQSRGTEMVDSTYPALYLEPDPQLGWHYVECNIPGQPRVLKVHVTNIRVTI